MLNSFTLMLNTSLQRQRAMLVMLYSMLLGFFWILCCGCTYVWNVETLLGLPATIRTAGSSGAEPVSASCIYKLDSLCGIFDGRHRPRYVRSNYILGCPLDRNAKCRRYKCCTEGNSFRSESSHGSKTKPFCLTVQDHLCTIVISTELLKTVVKVLKLHIYFFFNKPFFGDFAIYSTDLKSGWNSAFVFCFLDFST